VVADGRRPFYGEFAWAFDLLIDRPVRKECAAIADWLTARRILPGARLLDAGCGTGRYAAELARRGYVVHGVDRSPDLIAEARRLPAAAPRALSFAVGDLTALPAGRYDAILCRGVLNDFLEDDDRDAAFASFARSLRAPGVLVFDVREWEATAVRKQREPLFTKRVSTGRGTLTFQSVTALDPERRRLLVAERHTLVHGDRTREVEYAFTMRCWTSEEVSFALQRHGFRAPAFFGAYDSTVAPGHTDRLVVVTHRVSPTADR
jgi:SAM-dependent methyltransferase